VLDALADPTRRAVWERLSRGPMSVGQLAELLPVSRPAVSQHLKVLASAGLVAATPDGTRRIYVARREGLIALRDYLDTMWRDGLAAYAAAIDAAIDQENQEGSQE
jgi:DNA-binding transcriptional ArsR family regulator